VRTGPLGTSLDIRGIASIDATFFTGLPVRVTSSQSPLAHTLNSFFFSAMDPADVQLYLELPAVVGAAVQVTNSQFDLAAGGFSGGAHIEAQRLSGTAILTIDVIQANMRPLELIEGLDTVIRQL
jgi:hypothetical protein